MSEPSLLARLAGMPREELRARAVCEARKVGGRARFAVARPRWRSRDLARQLHCDAGVLVQDACDALESGDTLAAHRALARHFGMRERRWPISAAGRRALTREILEHVPVAAAAARARADAIVEGRYDLLGFRDIALGNPPDWQADVVHGRRAPRGFWSAVPFLDPASGDHKIIWEVNRHQHFLALGTAWWLTEDARYRQAFIAQIEDWIARNPPLDGINWASMLELGFRTLSWTWAVEFFSGGAERDATPWLVDLLLALDRQLAHVERNLSTYFSPNTHLTGEALALFAVSRAFPELRCSAPRAALGRSILLREARVQVGSDGGHAERSSHYHRYSTDFYLLATMVARLTHDPAAAAFESALRGQASYLRTIADSRGRLPNLGDDDAGQLFRFGGAAASDAAPTLGAAADVLNDPVLAVTPPDADICWILGRAPRAVPLEGQAATWPSRLLPDGGYFVSRRDDRGHHLVFDAGPHGFLNGGHAHADALSVLLTVGGEPVLVDAGTGTYTMDAAVRDGLRASTLHNTVTVDGHPFAVPRGPFHWDRVTDARMLVARSGPDMDFAAGAHDGYGFSITRAVIAIHDVGWLIVDHVSPARAARIEAWWHLHPPWSATPIDTGFALRHTRGMRLGLATTAPDRGIERHPYSPEYGLVQHATALRTGLLAAGPSVLAAYVPAADGPRAPRVALVERDGRARAGYVTWTFAIADGVERLVSIAFPSGAAQPANVAEWPQPCIQEARAPCVE